ncbi:hypothetical protein LR393_20255 [Kineosporia mesophila]|nr:hypothetical protein [Kineosporia mesophila]MCD5352406.1 hypothetical protein [Kineosporia mesophila]
MVGLEDGFQLAHTVGQRGGVDAAFFHACFTTLAGGFGVDLLDLLLGDVSCLALVLAGQTGGQGFLDGVPGGGAGLQGDAHLGVDRNRGPPVQVAFADQGQDQWQVFADLDGVPDSFHGVAVAQAEVQGDLTADQLDAVERVVGGVRRGAPRRENSRPVETFGLGCVKVPFDPLGRHDGSQADALRTR